MLEKIINAKQPNLTTGFQEPLPTLGPRVQKINPDTMQLIKVYESVTEAMNEDKNLKRPSISKAVEELGYQPKVKLNEGVRKTIEWYKHEGWI